MSLSVKRNPWKRALKPVAIVALLLCAGISESRAADPGAEAVVITATARAVYLFADPQDGSLDALQQRILSHYRSRLATDPALKLRVITLTDTAWDDASRQRLLRSADLASERTEFLALRESEPIPPETPALAAVMANATYPAVLD